MDTTELPLSLDDFIPPHLQKRQNRGASQTYNAHTDSSVEGDLFYKATMVLTDDSRDPPSPHIERRWIRYEGIGPTDEDGMPFASRSSVDKPREWYKNMYKVLHQMSDSEESDGDSNWPKPEDHHKDAFTQSNKSTFRTEESNGQPELEDRLNRRGQEASHLHITVRSNIRESPNMGSSTLRAETSPGSSQFRAATLPHSSSRRPSQTSPHYSSKVSQFIDISNPTHSSQNYNTQQSHQVLSNDKQRTSEPGRRQFIPDYSSRASQNNKETTSLQSLQQKSKSPSSASPSSGPPVLSPTFKESRRSTSKVLEQLEVDLRNFTEELNKDLDSRKQQPEATLEQCEEVILRRYSHRAGGSPEPKANKSRRRNTEEQDLSPICKAVVKFDFVAESEKEISLQRGTAVTILKKIDEHWLLGEQHGRRGIFPQSYIKVLTPGEPEHPDAPQLSGIALYDFKADSERELPLHKLCIYMCRLCVGCCVIVALCLRASMFLLIEGLVAIGLKGELKAPGDLASFLQVMYRSKMCSPTGAVSVHYLQGLHSAGSGHRSLAVMSSLCSGDGGAGKDWVLLRRRVLRTGFCEVQLTSSQVSSTLTLKERPCTVKAPAPSRLQELRGTLYRVKFNYSPKNADELQLNAGDMVTVTQQCEDGWYVGVCWRTEKFGTFPGNFVTLYEAP
ncbi:vinexin isoform 2-T10 [Anomaloglossus baeobatrachus]|uniref:vinexin isoform X2 n=1 Tax=Anomaloglossus baeobatrachus TaxID=238106 RepID=UPI003F50C311